MNMLAIDIGGTHMKILATGQKERREFESGPKLTPKLMVGGVKKLARDCSYDVVSMGYPGPVQQNRLNLAGEGPAMRSLSRLIT
jgi:polyphosphate glucokinase